MAYKRSEDYWQLDGSLLVQLDGVRYHLHRSRLVRVCGWFRGVLEDVSAAPFATSVDPGLLGSTVVWRTKRGGKRKKDIKGKGKATTRSLDDDDCEMLRVCEEKRERDLALAKRKQRKMREKHLLVERDDEKLVVLLDGLGIEKEEWEVWLGFLDDFMCVTSLSRFLFSRFCF
jgi:hypothetical protein